MNTCLNCNKGLVKWQKKFCSRSCSAMHRSKNTKRKVKDYGECKNCNKKIAKGSTKYCSHNCQWKYLHKQYIARWKQGLETGLTKGDVMSIHVRNWLFKTRNSQCESCGWGETNLHTKRVPLHIHHKDNDWQNNKPENLALLCPNCHSLTANYGGANRGNGRPYIVYKKPKT